MCVNTPPGYTEFGLTHKKIGLPISTIYLNNVTKDQETQKTKEILEKISPDEVMFLLQKGAMAVDTHSTPSSKTLDMIDNFRKEFSDHIETETKTDADTHKKLDQVIYHFEDPEGLIKRINAQVQKTNGRVTKLEGWKIWVLGGCAFASVMLPLFSYFYMTSQDYKIDLKIKTALEMEQKKTKN